MDYTQWRDHIQCRSDFATRITHLTRGNENVSAFDNLINILKEKKIHASSNTGYIVGKDTAVCLQDAPLLSIAENLLYEAEHSDHLRYEAYGLRFNKQWLYSKGARPVIYGETNYLKRILPESEYWRIVNLDLNDNEHLIDWTHEREWRFKGDLEFEYDEIEILVYSSEDYQKLVKFLQDYDSNILLQINGIVPLQSVIN